MSALRLLAAAHPRALSREALAALALELGADIPFFLDPRPAFVTGIGEEIEVLATFPELWVLLVNPGVSLATAEVFRAFDSLPPTQQAGRGFLFLPNHHQLCRGRSCYQWRVVLHLLRVGG